MKLLASVGVVVVGRVAAGVDDGDIQAPATAGDVGERGDRQQQGAAHES